MSIPGPIAAKVDRMFEDPVTGKVGYGKRSNYIVKLIQKDLAERGVTVSEQGRTLSELLSKPLVKGTETNEP
jgi:hypothetical protein